MPFKNDGKSVLPPHDERMRGHKGYRPEAPPKDIITLRSRDGYISSLSKMLSTCLGELIEPAAERRRPKFEVIASGRLLVVADQIERLEPG
jgi:hypothetical protein